jgi:uncharacterized protein YecE (DUF72 family)
VKLCVGTAGWALPREVRDRFAAEGTQLERYARRFNCVEINSSFYRPHRPATYARWAQSVPDDFRFSLKIPKSITHERRLVDVDDLLARFLDESSALGLKRDLLLVQFPPSFGYQAAVARPFFERLRRGYPGGLVCEPRHATWFTETVDAMFVDLRIGRVAADPSAGGIAMVPGGSHEVRYWRLHGSPRTYYSSYDEDALRAIANRLSTSPRPAWCIFDNTALGAATANALTVLDDVAL